MKKDQGIEHFRKGKLSKVARNQEYLRKAKPGDKMKKSKYDTEKTLNLKKYNLENESER